MMRRTAHIESAFPVALCKKLLLHPETPACVLFGIALDKLGPDAVLDEDEDEDGDLSDTDTLILDLEDVCDVQIPVRNYNRLQAAFAAVELDPPMRTAEQVIVLLNGLANGETVDDPSGPDTLTAPEAMIGMLNYQIITQNPMQFGSAGALEPVKQAFAELDVNGAVEARRALEDEKRDIIGLFMLLRPDRDEMVGRELAAILAAAD